MIHKGLTLPNREWDAYTDVEMTALDDLQPATLVFLAYGTRIDHDHAVQLAPYLVAHPRTRVLFRPFDTTIGQRDPTAWAAECYRRLQILGTPGNLIVPVELIPWNEPNVEWGSRATDWAEQIRFALTFAAAWRVLAPRVALHLPALSPSGPYQEGFTAYAAADLYAHFDVTDAHKYADTQVWPGPSYVGDRPVCVTEFNQLDPATFFAAHAATVRDACWFLLGGTPDQASCDLLRQPAAYQSFKTYQEAPMPTPSPTPFVVGAGILAKMHQEGDTPTSSEIYVKDGHGADQYSEATGHKGRYTYVVSENVTHFSPFLS